MSLSFAACFAGWWVAGWARLMTVRWQVTLVERWKGAPRDTTSEIENKSAFKAVYD